MTDRPEWQTIDRVLAGEATPDEVRAVEQWCQASPANALLVRALRERLAAPNADAWDIDAAWGRVADAIAAPERVLPFGRPAVAPAARRSARPIVWRVAAGLLVAAAGLATWRVVSDRAPARPGAEALAARELVAPRGRRVSARLPDGSHVTLHAGSRLRYAPTLGAGSGPRDVQLDGEGYFEVTHNARRPFRVLTAHALAEDLGTRFVVRAYPGTSQTEVVVTEGLVALRPAMPGAAQRTDSALVRPGQIGRVAVGAAPTVQAVADVGRYTDWTSGTLSFDGEPLAEVLPRLERWYDVDVVLADPSLGARRVVARLRDEPLPRALDALALVLGARVERVGRTVTIHARESR